MNVIAKVGVFLSKSKIISVDQSDFLLVRPSNVLVFPNC